MSESNNIRHSIYRIIVKKYYIIAVILSFLFILASFAFFPKDAIFSYKIKNGHNIFFSLPSILTTYLFNIPRWDDEWVTKRNKAADYVISEMGKAVEYQKLNGRESPEYDSEKVSKANQENLYYNRLIINYNRYTSDINFIGDFLLLTLISFYFISRYSRKHPLRYLACPYSDCRLSVKIWEHWRCDKCHNKQTKPHYITESCDHCGQRLETVFCEHCHREFYL